MILCLKNYLYIQMLLKSTFSKFKIATRQNKVIGEGEEEAGKKKG
jgi:hypothetical protein